MCLPWIEPASDSIVVMPLDRTSVGWIDPASMDRCVLGFDMLQLEIASREQDSALFPRNWGKYSRQMV